MAYTNAPLTDMSSEFQGILFPSALVDCTSWSRFLFLTDIVIVSTTLLVIDTTANIFINNFNTMNAYLLVLTFIFHSIYIFFTNLLIFWIRQLNGFGFPSAWMLVYILCSLPRNTSIILIMFICRPRLSEVLLYKEKVNSKYVIHYDDISI